MFVHKVRVLAWRSGRVLSKLEFATISAVLWIGAMALPGNLLAQSAATANARLSSTSGAMHAQGAGNRVGVGQFFSSRCRVTGDPSSNVNLRCGDLYHPYAETAIAVDPSNPDHLLVGANDYIPLEDRDVISRMGFFVSFDGGSTWTSGAIPGNRGVASLDPSPVFNARFGTAHTGHTDLACVGGACSYTSSVSTSHDGASTWDQPVVVAKGQGGSSGSEGAVLNDKAWLVADNSPSSPFYGRLYLTWSRYIFSQGIDLESPVYLSHSDDAGKTWSSGVEISGSNSAYCTLMTVGNRCADDSFSTPVVLPNGTVVVHFMNWDNTAAFEFPFEFDDQTMVVRSTDGGVTWSQPSHIADLEDGLADYPFDVFGFPTLTGHQFVARSVQGMTADPVTGDLYAFWSDNRDGVHDSLTPVTQTDVFMTRSTDEGLTWVGPTRLTSGAGDRFMPWGGAYAGIVRVMFLDGSYDYPNRTLYGVTMGSSSDGGNTWTFERVDTAPSNPNNASWFVSGAVGCYQCTYFIGDYQGMTMDSLGRAHIVWTDMRRDIGPSGMKAHDIEYARR